MIYFLLLENDIIEEKVEMDWRYSCEVEIGVRLIFFFSLQALFRVKID